MSRVASWGPLLLAVVVLAPSFAAHDAPDASGTWHVGANESVVKEDQSGLTACTVEVESGGRLVLRHSTLTMACLGGGTPAVNVRQGGTLVVEENGNGGSTLQAGASKFAFNVYGTLQAEGSQISGTRTGLIFWPSATNSVLRDVSVRLSGETGVEIIGTRGVTIEDSRLVDNPTGFALQIRGRGASPLIRQNDIVAPPQGTAIAPAVDVSDEASPRFEGNTISGGAVGTVRWNESAGSFVSNTVHGSEFTALWIDQRSTVEVRKNLLDGGSSATVQVRGSTPLLEGNTVTSPTGQRIGIRLDDSAATVRNNVVEDARVGLIAIYSDDLVVEGNTFRDVDDAGILCGDGREDAIECGRNVLLANNTISGAQDAILVNKLEGVIRDNVLHNSEDWGILALNRRPAILRNSFAGNGAGAAIVAHDVRVRVLNAAGNPVSGAKVTMQDATGDLDAVEGTTSSDGYLRVQQGVSPVDTFRVPDYKLADSGARTDHNPYAITVEKSGLDTETFTYPVLTSSPVVLRLGKKPDFVGVVEVAEEDLLEGEAVQFQVKVSNAGSGDASSVVATFYLDSKLVEARTLASLPKGATATETFAWAATKGNHLAVAVFDPENRIVEGDEANNRAEFVFAVEPGDGTTPPPDDDDPPVDDGPVGDRPDLTLGALVLSKARNVVEGDVVALLATVTNAGASDSAGTTVTLFDGLEGVEEIAVRGLAPGESWPVSTQWRASAGHREVALVVDVDDRVAEANEQNNRVSRELEVAEADPGDDSGGGNDSPGLGFAALILAVLAALATARRVGAGR